ncbi:MAG: TonB-dependent receptor [Spirosomaceae bacterium]|jgi:hypothetical protein|nr:TonB-dependent receptor [Spirosomataceae bacterium]
MKFIFTATFLLTYCVSMAQKNAVTGRIQDNTSQKPLLAATVQVKRLVKVVANGDYTYNRTDFGGTNSDSLGQYRLQLPNGEYVLEVSAVGYATKSRYLNLRRSVEIDFELSEKINQLDDVEIRTQKAESNVKSVEMSTIKINMQSLKTTPIVFGESDIIRALTLQPGVTNVGEGAGGFSVRGGRTDQNLVLLDDAPIFNTSHLLGLFTSINAEAVQSATLYKSGIPARYGGRLSSLLNMTTKTGREEKRTAVAVGPISSNALIERPFANKKGSLMLAGRGAYPNWMINAFPKRFEGSKASFYDFNGSLQYRLNTRNSLTITAYQSGDAFKFPEDTSYFWRSRVATAQWGAQLGSKLSITTKGILSHYTYGVKGLTEGFEYQLNARIRHHELRTDLLYQLTDKHRFEAGGNVIFYRFSPGTVRPTATGSAINERQLADEYGRESAVYLSYDWDISKRVSLQVGARYSMFQNVGGRVLTYQPNQPLAVESIADTLQFGRNEVNFNNGGFEPRALLKVELADNKSVKLGYNRTRQYMHLITNTTAISPVDYWKLANRYAPPQQAHQVSLGYYQNLQDNTFITSVEGFYKEMTQLIEYKDGASLLLNEHLETELLPAIGQSYGVEVSLQKTKGRLTGFVNYTWSRSLVAARSEFAIEQINQGQFYPSIFDKPHNLNVSAQWYLGSGWTGSTNFMYQTGRPLTYPDGQYVFNDNLIFNYSTRFASRLPDYHRLDLSLSYDSRRTKEQKKYSVLNISFFNLYARKNPYSIFFRQYLGAPRSYRLAVLGTVIPSVTLTKYW